MKANPGGLIAPADAVGRDEFVRGLWRSLERQSLVLTAERRIGKTTILIKLKAEAPRGVLCIHRDLESVRTPLEFVETVFRDVESHLTRVRRTAARTRRLFSNVAGAEIGEIKFPDSLAAHWKDLLTRTIEDLLESKEGRVVFLWDEIPMMLDNIKKTLGVAACMELLDTLRSIRQAHPPLRMVFTGSISLHNAIIALRRAGYSNDPTNDMDTIDVPPLEIQQATTLALKLFEGEALLFDEPELVARVIAKSVDGIPYFIHHVVESLVWSAGDRSLSAVDDLITACLTDPADRWHLAHYRERMEAYYEPRERVLALALLDALALTDKPIPFDRLFNLLKARIRTDAHEPVRETLLSLIRDHYVMQSVEGRYSFRFSLIRRWWRLNRG